MARMRRGNIPTEHDVFIGRITEAARLKRLLRANRVVTVVGTGGIGKSRLALQVSTELSSAFPDGIWRVDLDDVTDGALLASTVLHGIGRRDDGGATAEVQLAEHLAASQALLVLDGCDLVVAACAELVRQLLSAGPTVRLLCTSRRPLRVAGEAVSALGPMQVPEVDVEGLSAEAISQYDGVSLFLHRAGLGEPGSMVSDQTARKAAWLCQRLDGLPLAIELAADCLDVLSVEDLAERLDDPYRMLVAARRDVPERQRSLEALVLSTYELCSPAEQVLWARLAVFTGRFDLTAVEQVCTDETTDARSVLGLVRGLIDKSVLRRDDCRGRSWYRLSPLLRDYAEERLVELGERDRFRERHLEWCLGLAACAAGFLFRPTSEAIVRHVRASQLNIRTALDYCLGNPEHARQGLRLVSDLGSYWSTAGLVAEGRAWHERLLRAYLAPSPERVAAMRTAAVLAALDGDDRAEELSEASAALDDALGNPEIATSLPRDADRHYVSGLLALHRGQLAAACQHFDLGVASARVSPGLAAQLVNLAAIAYTLHGQPERGERYCTDFLSSSAASEDEWGKAYLLLAIAFARSYGASPQSALGHLRQAAQEFRRFDDRWGRRWLVACGPLILAAVGHARDAALMLGAASTHPFVYLQPLMKEPSRRCALGLRSELGETEFRRLTKQGASLTVEQAIDVAAGDRDDEETRVDAQDDIAALSRREREVAELVAQGRRNKEIAAALFISTRTAEGHVQHILTKLGLVSRTQLAAWFTHQRATAVR